MAKYYKNSVVEFINNLVSKGNTIVVDNDLKTCTNYNQADFTGWVMVCNKDYVHHWWFVYIFHEDYCTEQKKDLRYHRTNIQQEVLDNWDAIEAGTYVSSIVLANEKAIKNAEKKAALEAKLNAECKTFNVDFFAEPSFNEGGYLWAIDEIGKRLQNGEYSNLVLNDKIKIEFRTKNKRKDLPFTTDVCGVHTFTDDNKYGDLWEDIDDNLEMYILKALVGACYRKNTYDFEQIFNNLDWLEMYANNKKEQYGEDENVVKAADMLIDSIRKYTEVGNWYKTILDWKDKNFIIETFLNAEMR